MVVRRIGSGVDSVVTAEITAQMLMQRDVMSHMFVMDPMRVIPVLVLVLCKLVRPSAARCGILGPWNVAPRQERGSFVGGMLMGRRRWPHCGRWLLRLWQSFPAIDVTPSLLIRGS